VCRDAHLYVSLGSTLTFTVKAANRQPGTQVSLRTLEQFIHPRNEWVQSANDLSCIHYVLLLFRKCPINVLLESDRESQEGTAPRGLSLPPAF
jgi:hypothetical protein